MKIKREFVTNSSSTSYIFSCPKKIRRTDLPKHMFATQWDSFVYAETKKKLIAYAQNSKCTWIDEIKSLPSEYYRLPPGEFQIALREILDGNAIVIMQLDRDRVQSSDVIDTMKDLGAKLISIEAH